MKKILEETLEKNIALEKSQLVIQTFGNLSIRIDTDKVAIKPSGVNLKNLKANEISIVNLDNKHISGLLPSVDTPTHTYLYKNFQDIHSIVHTHSLYASSWAQSQKNIPCYGTTHADYVNGELPCTRPLTKNEIENNYEENTAKVIVETIIEKKLSHYDIPGILVGSHGVFSWGESSEESLNNAEVIEYLGFLAFNSINLNPNLGPVPKYLNDFHFNRKHGPNKYYGQ